MANQKFNISFVIGAVDNVTLKVMQINERVQKAFAPFQKAGSALGLLGAELGLKKIGAALGNVGEKGKAVFDGFVSAGLRLAAVAGTVAAAFKYVVGGAAETANEIKDASERIGVSSQMFQTLQYAATQTGVGLQKLEPLLTKFSQVIGEASEGGNEASAIFSALGVSLKGPDGQLRSMDDILPSLADKISKIEQPAVRNAVAVKLFGKEGVKFVQVLADGSKGIDEYRKRAEELGIVLGDDLVNDGAKLNNQIEEVGLVFSRLRDAAGAELFPVLKDLLTQLTQVFIENRPAIIAFAKSFAQDLPGTLKSLAEIFRGLWAAVQPLISIFNGLAKVFGAANVIFTVLAGVIVGKLIFSIYALMGALIKLGVITAATPIGWIAIGIGLVVGAIILLLRYWEPITQFFKNMGTGWAVLLRIILLAMGPIGWLAAIALTIYRNWEPIAKLFSSIGSNIAGAAQKLGNFFGFGSGAGATNPATGAPLNATATAVETAQAAGGISKTENRIAVDFNNLPPGTRIRTEKAEAPVDLSMGYGMVTQ